MAILICIDCGKEIERRGPTQERCVLCGKIRNRASTKEWISKNREKSHAYSAKWNSNNKEHRSVAQHHYYIFKGKIPKHITYKGMPFFDGWNPDKGGSFHVGADWIIANLGKKPEGRVSLDVVHHAIGFMPGNLRWADAKGQAGNRMHKVITQLRHELEETKAQLAKALLNNGCVCGQKNQI